MTGVAEAAVRHNDKETINYMIYESADIAEAAVVVLLTYLLKYVFLSHLTVGFH